MLFCRTHFHKRSTFTEKNTSVIDKMPSILRLCIGGDLRANYSNLLIVTLHDSFELKFIGIIWYHHIARNKAFISYSKTKAPFLEKKMSYDVGKTCLFRIESVLWVIMFYCCSRSIIVPVYYNIIIFQQMMVSDFFTKIESTLIYKKWCQMILQEGICSVYNVYYSLRCVVAVQVSSSVL